MKTFFYLSMILLLCPACYLTARESKKDTLTYEYPREIVVTGSRLSMPLQETPFSISLVGTEILSTLSKAVAIDEPMKLVPGVKVDNQANGSRVHMSIRGQGILTERGIRGIKILLDEIPVNDPSGFAPDFFDVNFDAVDRIEVLRGPAASLYGGSASGGIINITTKNSPDVPLAGEASSTFGSNNFWKGYGNFGGRVNKLNYLVSFSRTMGDGYREHTHFWGNNLYGKAIYTPTSTIKLTPIFGWTDFYHENPEGINLLQYEQDPLQANPDAVQYNEYLETNRITIGLTGLIVLQQHEINFSGYVRRTLFTEANNRTFNHRTLATPGASIQYSLHTGRSDDFVRNTFSVGTDLQWQTIDEHRVDNHHAVEGDIMRSNEQMKQRGVGLFVIDKIDFGSKWGFMLSLRNDNLHNEVIDLLQKQYDSDGNLIGQNNLSGNADFSKTTGRIGVTFNPMADLTLYSNLGQGFLPPATEELAQNPDQFGGFNTHLTSATSNTIELGARGKCHELFTYDLTGFYMTTENDFDRYRITDPLRIQETFYRNAASSSRYGLELYTKVSPVKEFDFQVAYTYSHFKYTNSTPVRIMMDDTTDLRYIVDGNWLPNSPMHQLYIDVQYSFGQGLFMGLASETLSKTYIDGSNEESEIANAYTLLHGRIGYTLQFAGMHGDIILSARNLLDKKYVAFTEPDPGGNAYQPGSGREFFAGIKIAM